MAAAEESGSNQANSNHGKRRVSTSTVKTSKAKVTEDLMAQSQYWISLLERIMFSSSLNEFFFHIRQDESSSSNKLYFDQCTIQLRYWLLKGKLAQCDDDIERAYSWYVKSKTLLISSASLFQEEISINIKRYTYNVIDEYKVNTNITRLACTTQLLIYLILKPN